MFSTLAQFGLITTGLLSILISLVTVNNPVGSKTVGKLWIGVNISPCLWSLPWCAGAFYITDENLAWCAIYFASICAILLPPLFLSFVYALLDKPLAQNKSVRMAWIASLALIILCLLFPHLFFSSGMRRVRDAYLPAGGVLLWVFSVQYSALFIWGVSLLGKEALRISGSQRNKIIYVIMGVAIGSGGGITTFLTPLGIYPYGIVLVPCYSILITYAILKHRLMDIAVIIRRTLIYSGVMSVLVLIYLGIVTIFTKLFQGIAGSQTVIPSAVAAGLITLCFQPIRRRIQSLVDRKFFRQYVDREEKLYELSRDVVTHVTPEAMGNALVRVLQETLHPKAAAIYLRHKDGRGFSRVASLGETPLPERMLDSNLLAMYLLEHPQPFVQDMPTGVAESQNTRKTNLRVKTA